MHVCSLIIFLGFLSASWSLLQLPRNGFGRGKSLHSTFRKETERPLLEQPSIELPAFVGGTANISPVNRKGTITRDSTTSAIPDIFKTVSTGIDESFLGTLPTLPEMAGCALVGGLSALIAVHDTNIAGISALILLLVAFLDHSLVYRLRDVGSSTFYLFVELLYSLGLLVKWIAVTVYQNSPLPSQFQSIIIKTDPKEGFSIAKATAANIIGMLPVTSSEPFPSLKSAHTVESPSHILSSLNRTMIPSDAVNPSIDTFKISGFRDEQLSIAHAVASVEDRPVRYVAPSSTSRTGEQLKGEHHRSKAPPREPVDSIIATPAINENTTIVSPYVPVVRIRKQSASVATSTTSPSPAKPATASRSNTLMESSAKQFSSRPPPSPPTKEKKVSPPTISTELPTPIPVSTASPSAILPNTALQERKSIDWAAVHRSGSEIYKMMQHQHASSSTTPSSASATTKAP